MIFCISIAKDFKMNLGRIGQIRYKCRSRSFMDKVHFIHCTFASNAYVHIHRCAALMESHMRISAFFIRSQPIAELIIEVNVSV